MRHLILVLAAALLAGASSPSHARAQLANQSAQVDVRRLMSAGEFSAAGLHKLSSGELEALNKWLGRFTQIRQTAQGGGSSCTSAIESQIDGTFEGWSGETIFKLTNGQIWQQSSYAYMYHYAYRPNVTIFPSGGGCKMKVEGLSDSIPVKRLR